MTAPPDQKLLVPQQLELNTQQVQQEITTRLLSADRQRASEVLLQLHYQFSLTVTSVEIITKK